MPKDIKEIIREAEHALTDTEAALIEQGAAKAEAATALMNKVCAASKEQDKQQAVQNAIENLTWHGTQTAELEALQSEITNLVGELATVSQLAEVFATCLPLVKSIHDFIEAKQKQQKGIVDFKTRANTTENFVQCINKLHVAIHSNIQFPDLATAQQAVVESAGKIVVEAQGRATIVEARKLQAETDRDVGEAQVTEAEKRLQQKAADEESARQAAAALRNDAEQKLAIAKQELLKGYPAPGSDDLSDNWKKVGHRFRVPDDATFLSIRRRFETKDPVVRKAFGKLERETKVKQDEIRKEIASRGITTKVASVTKHLNKNPRIGTVQMGILGITYVDLIKKIMDEKPDDEDLKKLVDDTAAFADEILRRLRDDDGPIAKVADDMVEIVMKDNKVTPSDLERSRLVDQVRATL